MEIPFDRYNREERAACAHLFRLLHEGLASAPERSGLARVLALLRSRGLDVPGRADGCAVLTEVALVRDAYETWKEREDVGARLDELLRLACRDAPHTPWSQLAPVLSDTRRTHPAQIPAKAERLGIGIGIGPEGTVRGGELDAHNALAYGALRGLFQAKPDLALMLPGHLVVLEAKLTEAFDAAQLSRTALLAEASASPLLRGALGYEAPPRTTVERLGDEGTGARLTWQDAHRLAEDLYPENDRTRLALAAVARLLDRRHTGARGP